MKTTTKQKTPEKPRRKGDWRDIWDSINLYRQARELPVYDYSFANDPHVARLFADDLKLIQSTFPLFR